MLCRTQKIIKNFPLWGSVCPIGLGWDQCINNYVTSVMQSTCFMTGVHWWVTLLNNFKKSSSNHQIYLGVPPYNILQTSVICCSGTYVFNKSSKESNFWVAITNSSDCWPANYNKISTFIQRQTTWLRPCRFLSWTLYLLSIRQIPVCTTFIISSGKQTYRRWWLFDHKEKEFTDRTVRFYQKHMTPASTTRTYCSSNMSCLFRK